MKMVKTKDTVLLAQQCLERESFNTTGALRGRSSPYPNLVGKLDPKYYRSFAMAEFALYSRDTPIAWYGPDGWHLPKEDYGSITTKNHQRTLASFMAKWIKEDSA
jgi:hypothetical protein